MLPRDVGREEREMDERVALKARTIHPPVILPANLVALHHFMISQDHEDLTSEARGKTKENR